MDSITNDVVALMGLDASQCADVESYVYNFDTNDFTHHRKGRFFCSPTFPLVEKLGVYGKLCFNGSRSWMHAVFSTSSTRHFQLVSRIWTCDTLPSDWECSAEDAYIFAQRFNSKKRSLYPDEHLFHRRQHIRIQTLCRPIGPPVTAEELLMIDSNSVLTPVEEEGSEPWSPLYSCMMVADKFTVGVGGSHYSAHDCVDPVTSLYLSAVFKDSDSWLKGTFGSAEVTQTVEARVLFEIDGEQKAFTSKFGPSQRVLQLPPSFFGMGMVFTMKCRVRALPHHPTPAAHDQPWRFPAVKTKRMSQSAAAQYGSRPLPVHMDRSAPNQMWSSAQSAPQSLGTIKWSTDVSEFIPRSRRYTQPTIIADREPIPHSSSTLMFNQYMGSAQSAPSTSQTYLEDLEEKMSRLCVEAAFSRRNTTSFSSNTSSGFDTWSNGSPKLPEGCASFSTEYTSADEASLYEPKPIGFERVRVLPRSNSPNPKYNQFMELVHKQMGIEASEAEESFPGFPEPSTPTLQLDPLLPSTYVPAATAEPEEFFNVAPEYTKYVWTGKLECAPEKLESLRYYAQEVDNWKLVNACADKIWMRDNSCYFEDN